MFYGQRTMLAGQHDISKNRYVMSNKLGKDHLKINVGVLEPIVYVPPNA